MKFQYKETKTGLDELALKSDTGLEVSVLFRDETAIAVYVDGYEYDAETDTKTLLETMHLKIGGEFKSLMDVLKKAEDDIGPIMREIRIEERNWARHINGLRGPR